MKNFIAKIISMYIEYIPNHKGKVPLLRFFGGFCNDSFVKSRYGVLMQADLRDNTNLWALLGWYDSVADEIFKIVAGECFIDIGANAGLFSLLAAKQVGEKGVCIAFEPQHPLFRKLVNNVARNSLNNVYCFNLAISSQSVRCQMVGASPGHTGKASILEGPKGTAWSVRLSDDLKIINKIIGDRQIVIKIDVEGHEYHVLCGLVEIMNTHNVHKVIVEVDSENIASHGSSVEDIYRIMKDNGFRPRYGVSHAKHYDEVFEIANNRSI